MQETASAAPLGFEGLNRIIERRVTCNLCRRRHRQHLRKLADERAASAGSLSYSSSSDRSSDEDEDGEGAEDNGASSSKTASRRGDERDAVDEFVRRRRRVRHVNGTATPATGEHCHNGPTLLATFTSTAGGDAMMNVSGTDQGITLHEGRRTLNWCAGLTQLGNTFECSYALV